jgi:hypothetical protein
MVRRWSALAPNKRVEPCCRTGQCPVTSKAVEKALGRADYANPVDTPDKRAHILVAN